MNKYLGCYIGSCYICWEISSSCIKMCNVFNELLLIFNFFYFFRVVLSSYKPFLSLKALVCFKSTSWYNASTGNCLHHVDQCKWQWILKIEGIHRFLYMRKWKNYEKKTFREKFIPCLLSHLCTIWFLDCL